MAEPMIRSLTAADVEPAARALERGNWGDRRAFFRAIVEVPIFDPLVAEVAGEVVGTGLGTRFGAVGWVGLIYVVPGHRSRGLGSALAAAASDRLDRAGCRSLVLVATDAARPIYERLGFAATARYRTFETSGFRSARPSRPNLEVRPIVAADLADIAALDRQASGEDRSALLAYLAGTGTGSVVISTGGSGGIAGSMLRPPWGGCGLVARDPQAALALLDARRAAAGPTQRVRAGLPDANEAGCAALLAAHWTEGWAGTRMTRGVGVPWRPEMIYGQFSFATG